MGFGSWAVSFKKSTILLSITFPVNLIYHCKQSHIKRLRMWDKLGINNLFDLKYDFSYFSNQQKEHFGKKRFSHRCGDCDRPMQFNNERSEHGYWRRIFHDNLFKVKFLN